MSSNSHPIRVALISASVLMLELAFIRQIPAEVKSISYFSNLILMASFFGLGLGCLLARSRSCNWLFPVGLLATFAYIYFARGLVVYEQAGQVHYWLETPSERGLAPEIPLFLSALLAFGASLLPFVALGQALAREMDHHSRLTAYAWDIAGSLVGTLFFALSAYCELPPWLFPAVIALVFALVTKRSLIQLTICGLAGAPFFFLATGEYSSYWSPYYLVQYQRENEGLRVWVNSSFHQFAVDFRNRSDEAQKMQGNVVPRFSYPYQIYKQNHAGKSPQRVLVLGAGTGNDVNIALINQAEQVTAVEIDPVIANLGRNLNTAKPYSSPKVTLIVDDARHYLQSTQDKFDLIVFGTLDSQTLLSGIANLRLENYVYTVQAMQRAGERLNDDGMVALYYSVFKPWLYGRIFSTVYEAFPDKTRIFFSNSSFLFNTLIVAAKNVPEYKSVTQEVNDYGGKLISTDDWPFLYLEKPTLADIYLKLLIAVVVLLIIALIAQRIQFKNEPWQLEFLFLGLGFTLLESAAIVRMALLFGSTWIINAIVFSAVLLTIFAANALVAWGKTLPLRSCWPALILALLFNVLCPLGELIQLDFALRVLACALLIGLPVFFAALCFSQLFDRQTHSGKALGTNLIGAMSGGFLEYLSMIFGMRAIWILLIGVYALAWGSSEVSRRVRN